MHLIDRYLTRQLLEVYVICMVSLGGLFVVFDAFSNMDEFMRQTDSTQDLLSEMGRYYACRMVLVFERLAAIVALISAMFTVTWIERYNEMTALAAAGISTRRVMIPLVVTGMMLSLGAAACREWAIPGMKFELARDSKNLKGHTAQEMTPCYDQQTDVLIQGHSVVAGEQRVKDPNFVLPGRLAGRATSVMAAEAWYKPPTADRPGGYLLEKVSQPSGFCRGPNLLLDGRPVIYRKDETPWLEANQIFVASDVSFALLSHGERLQQYSSTAELIAALRNRSLGFHASTRVLIHARMLQPVLDLVLLLLGLPFVLGNERRNVFLAVMICLVITCVFMVVTLGCHWLGAVSLVPPSMAAWLPLILFAPLACWLSHPLFR